MKTAPEPTTRCPFPDCQSNLTNIPCRIIAHSRLKTRNSCKRRRLCKVCGRTFTHTSGTVYHRMRRPKADFDRAAQMQAEGVPKASIARVLKASPSTVGRWLERAGKHAQAFHEEHSRIEDPVEFQLDEHRCKGVGAARHAWAYSGIEVWSRMWVGLHVANRTLRATFLFVRQIAGAVGDRWVPVLVTSDGFKYYEPVLTRVFGRTNLVYVQVKNRYAARGIVRTTARQILGTPLALEFAQERSEDSKRFNTSYIERLNLRKRACCSLLRRRNAAPARKPEKIQQALEIVRVFYNFVQRHSSLKFGGVKRTPAMQAGIFARPLTIREIFSWVAPPEEAMRRGQRRKLAQLA